MVVGPLNKLIKGIREMIVTKLDEEMRQVITVIDDIVSEKKTKTDDSSITMNDGIKYSYDLLQ